MNRTAFQIYGLKKNAIKTFVSTWNTANVSTGSSTNTQIKLPIETTGIYNFIVDWGDGSTLENITSGTIQPTHTYAVAGIYTISITGTIRGFSFGSPANTSTSDKLKILSITKWGPLRIGNSGGYFNGCTNITLNNITDILDLTGTNSLNSMFANCTSITTVGRMNEWNLSNIINLGSMFSVAGSSTTGVGLFNQDIGAWNVSKVTSFADMFRFTALFNNGGSDNIKNWNMSSALSLSGMFSRANSFNQPIANWERTLPDISTLSKVTNMSDMFSSVNRSFSFNQPIGNWNVSSVTSMSNMFYRSPFNQDIGSWNISKVAAWGSFGIAGSVSPFSPATLDLIYNGWSTRPVVAGSNIAFTSKFTIASLTGRNILTSAPNNWIINDGTAISGTANNGGLIRITTSQNHGWATGNIVYVFGVGGTTAANGTWTITVISVNVIELQGSSFNATWTSRGNVILS
jgi:hypothetical protein